MDCPYPQCKRCKEAYDKLRTKRDTLKAENKRYREALEKIAKENTISNDFIDALEKCVSIARTALEAK